MAVHEDTIAKDGGRHEDLGGRDHLKHFYSSSQKEKAAKKRNLDCDLKTFPKSQMLIKKSKTILVPTNEKWYLFNK